MTNKEQIIIDGVDVSGCCYAILPKNQCPAKIKPYAKETSCIACKEHNTKLNFCKNNPNCYFKQLSRKTQECEELKEKLYQIEDVVKPINEQLPEDNVIRQIMLILNDCNGLQPSRYRKALEEIEEKITALHYTAIPFHRGITHELADIVQEYKNKILDIISKAKGEEDERKRTI